MEAKGMGRCQLRRVRQMKEHVQGPRGCMTFTCAIPSKEIRVVDVCVLGGGGWKEEGAENY